MIAKTAVIYPNVKLGKNVIIEDYCIIGSPIRDGSTPETIIGDNAHIRSFTVIYAGNKIGDNFHTGNKANIRENNIIGNNVSIGAFALLEYGILIEDYVKIQSCALICEFAQLKTKCWIGAHTILTSAKYPNTPDSKKTMRGPIVHESAIIASNVTINPGVEIGYFALVGAGSMVTKNVEPKSIVFGNPAKMHRLWK